MNLTRGEPRQSSTLVLSKYRMPLKCNGLGQLASADPKPLAGLCRGDRLTTCGIET
jgi:hypothetical protein